jgi:hypothetical protein
MDYRDRGNIGWMYNEKSGERRGGTARVTRTGYVIRVEIFRQAFLTPRLTLTLTPIVTSPIPLPRMWHREDDDYDDDDDDGR